MPHCMLGDFTLTQLIYTCTKDYSTAERYNHSDSTTQRHLIMINYEKILHQKLLN